MPRNHATNLGQRKAEDCGFACVISICLSLSCCNKQIVCTPDSNLKSKSFKHLRNKQHDSGEFFALFGFLKHPDASKSCGANLWEADHTHTHTHTHTPPPPPPPPPRMFVRRKTSLLSSPHVQRSNPVWLRLFPSQTAIQNIYLFIIFRFAENKRFYWPTSVQEKYLSRLSFILICCCSFCKSVYAKLFLQKCLCKTVSAKVFMWGVSPRNYPHGNTFLNLLCHHK